MEVDKAPAFYETWWAYTSYVIVVLLVGYSFYYRAKRRMQLRHELQIVQIEKEKSEELVQAKLRYFTNISPQLYTLMYQTKYLILYYQLQGKIKPTYLRNRSVLK